MTKTSLRVAVLTASLVVVPQTATAGEDGPTPLNLALQPGSFLSFDGANARATVAFQHHIAEAWRLGFSASTPLHAESRFGLFAEASGGQTRLASGVRASMQIGFDWTRQALSLALSDTEASLVPALLAACGEIEANPCSLEAIDRIRASYEQEHSENQLNKERLYRVERELQRRGEGSEPTGARLQSICSMAHLRESCSVEDLRRQFADADALFVRRRELFESQRILTARPRGMRQFLDVNGVPGGEQPVRTVFGYAGIDLDARYTRVEAFRSAITGNAEPFDAFQFQAIVRATLNITRGLIFTARGGVTVGRAVATRTVERCTPVTTDMGSTASRCSNVQQLRDPRDPEVRTSGSVQLGGIYLFRTDFNGSVPGVEVSGYLEQLGQPGTSITGSAGLFIGQTAAGLFTRYGVALDVRRILWSDTDSDLIEGQHYVVPRLVIGASF